MPESEVRAAVTSALEVVSMSAYMNRATHTLSGGQRQRVAIAGGSKVVCVCMCGCGWVGVWFKCVWRGGGGGWCKWGVCE